jgi:FAD/FMN-containing dehydrogenase
MADWEKGADLVARMCLLPSELGSLLEEAGELRRLAASSPGPVAVGLSAHVGAGILRVAVSGLSIEGTALDPWVKALQTLRTRLEERGGTLTLSVGPDRLMTEVGAWGSAGREKRLMEGLKAQFDPEGILAPGRLAL